jgi:CheY-like chemotaxis protein
MNERYGLDLSCDMHADVEPQSSMLKAVLFRSAHELLVNVAKHAGVDQAALCLERPDEGHLRLTTEDRGEGFAPEELETENSAVGFGLFSVQERMEAIGGRVEVQSTPGGGTRVSITVPDQAGLAPEWPVAANASVDRDVDEDICRIIVADDHDVVRQSLVALIEKVPRYTVVGQAADGREAVDLAVQGAADVIVLDVSMPELDGVAAARSMRRAGVTAAIIGLSVHQGEAMTEAMLQAGADAYLNKGQAGQTLIDAIEKYRPRE